MIQYNFFQKLFLIIFFGIFLSSITSAETDLSINGYIYEMPIFMKFPESAKYQGIPDTKKDIFINLSRIRVRPTFNFGVNDRITAHYEMDVMQAKLNMPFLSSAGKTNRQAVNMYWNIANKEISHGVDFVANHYIDILYYKHIFDFGEVVFGRQLISWGVGRVWQPTDLFNPINPANFSKFEKDGADAVSAKYYIGNFTDLELVYNFREKWEDGNFGGRFRTNYSEYDISVMSGYFDKRFVVGADFAGNLYGAGFRGEGIFSAKSMDSNYIRCILGLDYQFTSKLYGMVEYQYNGGGAANKEKYLEYFQRLYKGEIQNLSRNYIAATASYEFHPLVASSLTNISNLNDGSGYAGMTCKYSALDNLNVSLGGMFFYGNKFSEYWYYSTSFYLLGEFYF